MAKTAQAKAASVKAARRDRVTVEAGKSMKVGPAKRTRASVIEARMGKELDVLLDSMTERAARQKSTLDELLPKLRSSQLPSR
jgi:hypothetical protein